jgi:hypothetical protein
MTSLKGRSLEQKIEGDKGGRGRRAKEKRGGAKATERFV